MELTSPLNDFKDRCDSYVVMLEEFKNVLSNTMGSNAAGPPDFTIELWGAEVEVVNWDVITPYLTFVHSIVIAISYCWFFLWLSRRISGIIYTDY